MTSNMSSLYVHIPFCVRKCHYCNFASCEYRSQLAKSYVEALLIELSRIAEIAAVSGGHLGTVFFGGGTPTCLPADLLTEVINHVYREFPLENGAEISVEANPGTVDSCYLDALLAVGVNRISLGVQSFDSDQLKILGRLHSSEQAVCAAMDAKKAGFENINLDLMSGLPGQATSSWEASLQQAFQLKPHHLSLYQLSIEEKTIFADMMATDKLVLPSEDSLIAMNEVTEEICQSNGFEKYEVSNYCLKGYRCRHNINYWRNNDYYGAGAAAVSYLDGVREKRIETPMAYIDAIFGGGSLCVEREVLSKERSYGETVMMGLRLVEGLELKSLHRRYGVDPGQHYGSTLKKLVEEGFIEITQTHMRITTKGWSLSNQIMAELV